MAIKLFKKTNDPDFIKKQIDHINTAERFVLVCVKNGNFKISHSEINEQELNYIGDMIKMRALGFDE